MSSDKHSNPTVKRLIAAYLDDQTKNRIYNNSQKNSEVIRIATYNVQFWTRPGPGARNYPDILKVISELAIDVLILEEVAMGIIPSSRLHTDLNALGYSYIIFCNAQNYMGGEYGNLIASKFPILQSSCQPLVKYKVGRSVIIADIQVSIFDIIRIYGFHLDVFDNSEDTRLQQIQSILVSANQSPYPTILAGDYNSVRRNDYTDEEWNQIVIADTNRGIITQTKVTDFIEANGWKTSFDMISISNPKYTAWSKRTIDFLYCNSMVTVDRSFVYHTDYSDHIPVIVDLKLKNNFVF